MEARTGETRAAYLMRVAAAYIRRHCPGEEIDFDGTTCDGYCLADDLDAERSGMSDETRKEVTR